MRIPLLVALIMIAAPVQAQPDWRQCLVDKLTPEEALTGSVATGAVAVAVRCRPLYSGKPGGDVDEAVALIERIRAKVPRPAPRGDLRF